MHFLSSRTVPNRELLNSLFDTIRLDQEHKPTVELFSAHPLERVVTPQNATLTVRARTTDDNLAIANSHCLAFRQPPCLGGQRIAKHMS